MKKPYVVPLPPEVVALLESKHQGAASLGLSPNWLALKSHLLQTAERMKRWSSHEGLDPSVETAQEQLAKFEQGLAGETKLEDLTQSAYRLFGALNEFARLRASLSVCKIPEIDEAVQALYAVRRGRLEWPEVEPVKERLIARVDHLVQLFKDGSEHLPEEIQQALLKGFASMNTAVAQMNTRDDAQLSEAAANLANAGTILEHLDKWQKEFEAENSCEVPVVGREVQDLMMELQSNGALSSQSVDFWYNELAPKLQDFWGPARHDFFMTRAQKDRLVGRIDTRLYELQELENMTPQEQFDNLRDLADAFAEVPSRTYQREWFEHHPQPWLYDTFVAVLAKGVPRYQIDWLIEEMSQSSDTYELARYLKEYLRTDDRDFLLDALDHLQRESQRNYDL